MTAAMHPQVATLLGAYARDLRRIAPSRELDARIGALVARPDKFSASRPRRRSPRFVRFAAAAAIAALAVAAGIFIGMKLPRARGPAAATEAPHESAWPPAGFSMWPTDSVAFKIPAEYSPNGALVAVDGKTKAAGTRYWVDIVVSNDGTIRIRNVVPAGETHGVRTQAQ